MCIERRIIKLDAACEEYDACVQKLAALLSDGSIAVWESLEADLWEETAEEMGTLGANGPELSAQGSFFELPGTSVHAS